MRGRPRALRGHPGRAPDSASRSVSQRSRPTAPCVAELGGPGGRAQGAHHRKSAAQPHLIGGRDPGGGVTAPARSAPEVLPRGRPRRPNPEVRPARRPRPSAWLWEGAAWGGRPAACRALGAAPVAHPVNPFLQIRIPFDADVRFSINLVLLLRDAARLVFGGAATSVVWVTAPSPHGHPVGRTLMPLVHVLGGNPTRKGGRPWAVP